MNRFDRDTMIGRLKSNTDWDVLIIGGGATGLGIAVDGATRGFKTLLIEQHDFSKGTSSRSTKLVHGGVRYLAQGNFGLVMEALKERGLLLKNAPHLTSNASFIIPCYSWFRGVIYGLGLKIYDWLSGRLSLGKSRLITKKELCSRLPVINNTGLKCGVLYHDGAFDDARLAINLAQTCAEKGGTILNYFKVVALIKDSQNKIQGAKIVDQETGLSYDICAKVVINATGVFADEVLRLDNPKTKSIIRPSQGVHLVFDNSFLQSNDGIMIPHTDDGRVLFAVPWQQQVLVGTTDTPLDSHSPEPRALDQEIDFILNTAGRYLSRQPTRADVLSVFAGLRPLAATENKNKKTKELSRSHKIIIAQSNLVSIIGGKWTTYRKMAEDCFTAIISRNLLPYRKCITKNLQIHGFALAPEAPLSYYGSDRTAIEKLCSEIPDLSKPIAEGTTIIAAQVIWAVRNEMARTVEDVLARRTRLLFTNAKLAQKAAPLVAAILKSELKQDESWEKEQIAQFSALASEYLPKPM